MVVNLLLVLVALLLAYLALTRGAAKSGTLLGGVNGHSSSRYTSFQDSSGAVPVSIALTHRA